MVARIATHYAEGFMFPPIESPCPLQSIQFPQSGNFNCSSCKREVHDISAMNFDERTLFLAQCRGNVCVSYKVKANFAKLKNGAIAGLFVLSATGLALPAAALDGDTLLAESDEILLMGGIKLPEQGEHVNNADKQDVENGSEARPVQLIPIVEETSELL